MTAERAQTEAVTLATVERFNDALNRHDVDGMMAMMSQDCVFENTFPAPDGTRFSGQAEVRGFWEEFFRSSPRANIQAGEIIVAGERCTVLWTYRWGGNDAQQGHVRGVDVIRVRDGKIVEKLSYVKG